MRTISILIINYYIIMQILITCQLSPQEECADKKQQICQKIVDESANHLTKGTITPELCCPLIKQRNCLQKIFAECGLGETSSTLRPAECVKYDDGMACGRSAQTSGDHDSKNSSIDILQPIEKLDENKVEPIVNEEENSVTSSENANDGNNGGQSLVNLSPTVVLSVLLSIMIAVNGLRN